MRKLNDTSMDFITDPTTSTQASGLPLEVDMIWSMKGACSTQRTVVTERSVILGTWTSPRWPSTSTTAFVPVNAAARSSSSIQIYAQSVPTGILTLVSWFLDSVPVKKRCRSGILDRRDLDSSRMQQAPTRKPLGWLRRLSIMPHFPFDHLVVREQQGVPRSSLIALSMRATQNYSCLLSCSLKEMEVMPNSSFTNCKSTHITPDNQDRNILNLYTKLTPSDL